MHPKFHYSWRESIVIWSWLWKIFLNLHETRLLSVVLTVRNYFINMDIVHSVLAVTFVTMFISEHYYENKTSTNGSTILHSVSRNSTVIDLGRESNNHTTIDVSFIFARDLEQRKELIRKVRVLIYYSKANFGFWKHWLILCNQSDGILYLVFLLSLNQ